MSFKTIHERRHGLYLCMSCMYVFLKSNMPVCVPVYTADFMYVCNCFLKVLFYLLPICRKLDHQNTNRQYLSVCVRICIHTCPTYVYKYMYIHTCYMYTYRYGTWSVQAVCICVYVPLKWPMVGKPYKN